MNFEMADAYDPLNGGATALWKWADLRPDRLEEARVLRPAPRFTKEKQMTSDTNYTTSFTVNQTPEVVFAAIIEPRAWWSGEFEGDTSKLGDVFTYRYKDLHYSKQQVTEQVPGKRVAWHVLEGRLSFVEDKTEWACTTIAFDIARKGDKTEVVFTHEGLKPAVECYSTCSDAWTALIQGSLKQMIESGKTELIELDAPTV